MISLQHDIILEEHEVLKAKELVADQFNQYEPSFRKHEEMIRKMLDPAVDETRLALESVKSSVELTSRTVELSDMRTINGMTWKELKFKISDPKWNFYKFYVSNDRS